MSQYKISATIGLLYEDGTTRNYTFENITSEAASALKAKILAINANENDQYANFYNTFVSNDGANASDFDAIFFAGGHGVMWDFADSAAIQKVTRDIYERGGIVSAVCHGPAALVNVKLTDGKFLVDGKNLTSFTNGEETEVQATDIVPFLLETELKNHGAIHHAAANWSNHVEVDGRLVTGQNPASAAAVGEAVVKLLR